MAAPVPTNVCRVVQFVSVSEFLSSTLYDAPSRLLKEKLSVVPESVRLVITSSGRGRSGVKGICTVGGWPDRSATRPCAKTLPYIPLAATDCTTANWPVVIKNGIVLLQAKLLNVICSARNGPRLVSPASARSLST